MVDKVVDLWPELLERPQSWCFDGEGTSRNGWRDNRLALHGATSKPGCAGQPATGFLMVTS